MLSEGIVSARLVNKELSSNRLQGNYLVLPQAPIILN